MSRRERSSAIQRPDPVTNSFDVVIIGSGPAGYVCAIRASQLGLKVALVEREPVHGGTCLRVGCIPSKALLHASEMFENVGTRFAALGIRVVDPRLDLAGMMAHKDGAVDASVRGVAFLFKKNGVTTFLGEGRIDAPGRVEVKGPDGSAEMIEAGAIVIATGSEPVSLPGIHVDEKRVVTSTGALALSEVPARMTVIGGGVIGLELGSVWRRLGAEVTVVEFEDRLLPGFDGEIARHAQRLFGRQGMKFRLATKVTAVTDVGKEHRVALAPAQGAGAIDTIAADVVLVAVGRRPYTKGLGLAATGVARDAAGRILASNYRTSVEGIFAIGDVIAGPMLAHKAEDEGIALAEILAGRAGHVNYGVIPSVVYTAPEIAAVGQTEEELKSAGIAYRSGKFPMTASGRARAMNDTDGFTKVLADDETDRVLGVHIIGPHASELIAEAAVLMEFSGSAEDLARVCHAHPTLSETVREAAMAAWTKAIHL